MRSLRNFQVVAFYSFSFVFFLRFLSSFPSSVLAGAALEVRGGNSSITTEEIDFLLWSLICSCALEKVSFFTKKGISAFCRLRVYDPINEGFEADKNGLRLPQFTLKLLRAFGHIPRTDHWPP
ncbi:hypothetical protein H6P81_017081 [Aristolochia fimbriata]|uniref:LAGLIDADG homing endonuclease n=1 Tax=Aristolochia fimbriata TaxID=158543 RepID=A0AAV7E086_ARIFI|nr:hypothetical protein H6P81_017081 [Aristolochia fimbriata]